MRSLQLRVLRDRGEFRSVGPDWARLHRESNSQNVFLTWEYSETWWNNFGDGHRLHIVTVEEGARLVALLPLFESSTRLPGVRKLRLLGQEHADYGGVLAADDHDDAVALIVSHLGDLAAAGRTILELTRLEEDGTLWRVIRQARVAARYRTVESPAVPCPFVDLLGPVDPRAAVLRTSKRTDAARLHRRLSEQHELALTIDSRNGILDAMDELTGLHEARWRSIDHRQLGMFSQSNLRFARGLVETLGREDRALVALLRADGRAIAGCLVFESGGRWLYYKTAFDLGFAQFDPGKVLLMLVLQEAIDDGISEFNLGRGAERYKARWATGSRPLVTIYLSGSAVTPAEILRRYEDVELQAKVRIKRNVFRAKVKLRALVSDLRSWAISGWADGRQGPRSSV